MKKIVLLYDKFSLFVFRNYSFRAFFIIIWILLPLNTYEAAHNFRGYFSETFVYELLWYIIMAYMVMAQNKVDCIIRRHFDIGLDYITKAWSYFFTLLYATGVLLCAAAFINAFTGSIYSLSAVYGRVYAAFVFAMRILLFLPAFINIFRLLVNFVYFSQIAYSRIETAEELLKTTNYISVFRKINKTMYFGYSAFVIICFTALSMKDYFAPLRLMISGEKTDADISFYLQMLFLVVPVLLALSYYDLVKARYKKMIFAYIANIQMDKNGHERVKHVFFDHNSPYSMHSPIGKFVFEIVVPIIVSALIGLFMEYLRR